MLYVSLTFPLAFQCRLMMLPYIKIANPSYSTDRIKIISLKIVIPRNYRLHYFSMRDFIG